MENQLEQQIETLLRVEQVAQYLNVSPNKIREMARTNKIKAIKIGDEWRFKKHYVLDYIKEQEEDRGH